MNLTEMKINEFMKILASDAPAPGGGAGAALAGSMGCALIEMVVALTKGKPRYAEFETLMAEISEKGESLRQKLLDAAERDAEAFSLVGAAYKMEKGTDEQKNKRKAAIEDALKKASEAPLELLKLTHEAILLCERAVGNSNPNVASDLGVSAILLDAAAKGAHINVLVNLDSIEDKEFVRCRREESESILRTVSDIAERIGDGKS